MSRLTIRLVYDLQSQATSALHVSSLNCNYRAFELPPGVAPNTLNTRMRNTKKNPWTITYNPTCHCRPIVNVIRSYKTNILESIFVKFLSRERGASLELLLGTSCLIVRISVSSLATPLTVSICLWANVITLTSSITQAFYNLVRKKKVFIFVWRNITVGEPSM